MLLYTSVVRLSVGVASIIGLFNTKVGEWVKGRSHWKRIEYSRPENQNLVWVHCASLGEFEQARPIIEELKAQDNYQILVSFFSPSGFNTNRVHELADVVTYLPTDTRANAKAFIDKYSPDAIHFGKYEFWYNFMNEIHSVGIPFALVSAYFQEGHSLLKFPASLLGRRLSQFDRIFAQDADTQRRLELFGLKNAVISGDTRVDRVIANANKMIDLPEVEQFVSGRQVMVIGSNWPQDDELLFDCVESFPNLRFIVAPHQLSKKQEDNWQKRFQGEIILWDDLIAGNEITSSKILYVNKVGLLSKLYRYADVVYIGGGFGVAVHNTLEAAVYKVPVICGPKNERFLEIQALKALNVIHEIADAQQLKGVISELLENAELRSQVSERADEYFTSQSGATSRIIDWLTEEK